MREIKKALILAGGWGTRFLPATKIIPKEMLPIGNKPTLVYLLEECKASGIEEVMVVVRERGLLTEKYFERNEDLEANLRAGGKNDLLELISDPSLGLKINFIEQDKSLPSGHAAPVLSAADWIGNDPFVLVFCDDLVHGNTSGIAQLTSVWKNNPDLNSVVMSAEVPLEEINKFSSVKYKVEAEDNSNLTMHEPQKGFRLLDDYIEKPQRPEDIFSSECFIGRAVYGAEILDYIRKNLQDRQSVEANGNSGDDVRGAAKGEFSLWDAMLAQTKEGKVGVVKIDGKWLTTGNPDQFREASRVILGY